MARSKTAASSASETGDAPTSTTTTSTTTTTTTTDVGQKAPLAPACDRGELPPTKDDIGDHLPPIVLVLTVMACSGFLFLYAFRDAFSTGRVIGGAQDDAYLSFTNSKMFFRNERGWKSTQGGLSAIQPVTTDANNMGGLFVRKVGGAACVAFQLQKLVPFLFHPLNARWARGHFRPLLATSVVANLCLAAFYAFCVADFLETAGADGMPKLFAAVLLLEAVVMAVYLVKSGGSDNGPHQRGPAVAMVDGKTPNSVVSRIVARTTVVCSGAVALIAGRDFFFPGTILSFVPRDDIYLEWTGAFIHSPPDGSPEAWEHGIGMGLHLGDRFLSQLLALNLLILCLYKAVAAFGIPYGNDGGGLVQARMIWKAQTVGNVVVFYVFRLFAPAAKSASLDLRWHLMMLAYDTFILGLYGFM